MKKLLASRSSSGLGHRPFTAATRVRIPYGMPHFLANKYNELLAPWPFRLGAIFRFVLVLAKVIWSE